MTHEDAVMQAIIDSPDHDTPRLDYADWLEENGQGARAEFIRVQIELARGPDDSLWPASQRAELEARERTLLEEYEQQWLGPHRGLLWWKFRRGFIEAVGVPARTFLREAEVLFRTTPVRQVHLQMAEGHTGGLAACHHLGRLNALDLSFSRIGDAGLRELLTSPHLAGLHALGLHETGIGPSGLQELLARGHLLPNLVSLDLSGCQLSPEALGWLAASSLSDHLQTLNLANTGLTDVGAEAMANGLCALQALYLGQNLIGERGLRALVRSRFWANLVDFDLNFNRLSDAAANELLAAPQPVRLTSLDLRANGISPPVQQALRERLGASVCRFRWSERLLAKPVVG
jgi:uncharacterized protein (TIGR02996 family)